MNRWLTVLVVWQILWCCDARNVVHAQNAELTSVFPFACQAGESVEVTLNGSNLETATQLFFAPPGLQSQHLENNRFRVTVDGQTGIHDRDVWCVTAKAMTNPRRFVVTRSSVIVEDPKNDSSETAQQITVPSFVCARFEKAADIDWYRFAGKRGQRVTIECRSRTLDGLAEPVVTVVDPDGIEVVHSTGQRREPIVSLELLVTGEYTLQVHERAYRQNDHSLYSISISDQPWLLATYPSLLQRGKKTLVTLYGFQLPDGKSVANSEPIGIVSIQREIVAPQSSDSDNGQWTDSSGAVRQGFRFSLPNIEGCVNFGLTREEVTAESEPDNDRIETAQPISIPARINGRFLKKGDIDWFTFSAKKGETLWFEAFGERIGRMMDLDISIHDASGKPITTFKDFAAPKGFPATFPVGSLDCTQSWKVPADGDYRMIVRDLYGGSVAGLDRTYELSIRRPRPGFQLFARPIESNGLAGVTIPRGGKAVIEIIAVRQDGFNGDIPVEPAELPNGLVVPQAWIGPSEVSTMVSIEAPAEFLPDKGSVHAIRLQSIDRSNSKLDAIRSVAPIHKGGNAVRLTQGLFANVGPQALFNVSMEAESHVVPAGSMLRLMVQTKTANSERNAPIQVELKSLPTGVKPVKKDIPIARNAGVIAMTLPAKLTPGNYSVVASAATKLTPQKTEATASEKKAAKPVDTNAWSNSVSFQVIKPPVSVAVKPKQVKLKRGESADIEVTIKRLDKSVGDVTLQLESGSSHSAINSKPVTLPNDKNSGTIRITALAEAVIGKLDAAAVKATLQVGDRNVVFRLPVDLSISE